MPFDSRSAAVPRPVPLLRPVLFVLCLVALALANDAAGGEQGPGRKAHWVDPDTVVARLTQQLDLTDAQQAEIRPLVEQQAERLGALRERARSGDRSGMREEAQAAREEFDREVAAVLDPEQLAEYQRLRENRRHQGRHQ